MVQAKKNCKFFSTLLFLLTLQSTQVCLVSLICSHWYFESFFPPIYLRRHWPYLDYQLLLPKLDLPLTKLLLQIFSCSNQRGFSKIEMWTSLIKYLQIGFRKKQNKTKILWSPWYWAPGFQHLVAAFQAQALESTELTINPWSD